MPTLRDKETMTASEITAMEEDAKNNKRSSSDISSSPARRPSSRNAPPSKSANKAGGGIFNSLFAKQISDAANKQAVFEKETTEAEAKKALEEEAQQSQDGNVKTSQKSLNAPPSVLRKKGDRTPKKKSTGLTWNNANNKDSPAGKKAANKDSAAKKTASGSDKSKSSGDPAQPEKSPPPAKVFNAANFDEIQTVEVSLSIGPNVKNTRPVWQKAMTKVLSYCQKVNSSAAIVPYTGRAIPVITDYSHYPEMNIDLEEDYVIFKVDWALAATGEERGRYVSCCVQLGFNKCKYSIATTISKLRRDFQTMGAYVNIKPSQVMDTLQDIYLLGAPAKMDCKAASLMVDDIFKTVEEAMMREHPEMFPPTLYGGPLPDMAIIREPPGRFPPDEPPKPGKRRPRVPEERKSLTLMYPRIARERVLGLLRAAKDGGYFSKSFGKFCIPTECPDEEDFPDSSNEHNRYVQMILSHTSLQCGYGSALLNGLLFPDLKFDLPRTPGADNAPRANVNISVREVLLDMKLNGKPVFILLVRTPNGRYVAYYPGTLPHLNSYVKDFVTCSAAQVYFYLLKR